LYFGKEIAEFFFRNRPLGTLAGTFVSIVNALVCDKTMRFLSWGRETQVCPNGTVLGCIWSAPTSIKIMYNESVILFLNAYIQC